MPTKAQILARLTETSRASSEATARKRPEANAVFNIALRAHEPAYAMGIPQAEIDAATREGWRLGRADAGM